MIGSWCVYSAISCINRSSLFRGGALRVEAPWPLGPSAAAPVAAGAIVGAHNHPIAVYEVVRGTSDLDALGEHVRVLRGYIDANAPRELPPPTVWVMIPSTSPTPALVRLQQSLAGTCEFLGYDP